jgi:hypothetical protein
LDDFDDTPLYPHASYVISAAEWNFWKADDVASRLPEDRLNFAPGARRNLTAIRDKLPMINPGEDIAPGIRAIDTSGHTPGHISIEIAPRKDALVVLVDALTQLRFLSRILNGNRLGYHYDAEREVATRRASSIGSPPIGAASSATTFRFPALGLWSAARPPTGSSLSHRVSATAEGHGRSLAGSHCLPQMGEGRLDFVEVRMLTSSHALVFGSLECSLVGLPPLQNRQLLGNANVVGFDNLHGALKCPAWPKRHPIRILPVMHDFLLPGTLVERFTTPSRCFASTRHASVGHAERTSQGPVVRNTLPDHLVIPTMRGNGLDQRRTNDA